MRYYSFSNKRNAYGMMEKETYIFYFNITKNIKINWNLEKGCTKTKTTKSALFKRKNRIKYSGSNKNLRLSCVKNWTK